MPSRSQERHPPCALPWPYLRYRVVRCTVRGSRSSAGAYLLERKCPPLNKQPSPNRGVDLADVREGGAAHNEHRRVGEHGEGLGNAALLLRHDPGAVAPEGGEVVGLRLGRRGGEDEEREERVRLSQLGEHRLVPAIFGRWCMGLPVRVQRPVDLGGDAVVTRCDAVVTHSLE